MSAILDRCNEKYGIDFEKKVRQLLPYFWSQTIGTDQAKTRFLNLAYTLFSGLGPINTNFVTFCALITNKLAFTGQVIALEALLNDNFDQTDRRITISCFNNNFIEGIDIYLDTESDPTPIDLYLDTETSPTPITLFLDSEVFDPDSLVGVGFVVNVPNNIPVDSRIIRALLDIYVIAPQTYQINRF